MLDLSEENRSAEVIICVVFGKTLPMEAESPLVSRAYDIDFRCRRVDAQIPHGLLSEGPHRVLPCFGVYIPLARLVTRVPLESVDRIIHARVYPLT